MLMVPATCPVGSRARSIEPQKARPLKQRCRVREPTRTELTRTELEGEAVDWVWCILRALGGAPKQRTDVMASKHTESRLRRMAAFRKSTIDHSRSEAPGGGRQDSAVFSPSTMAQIRLWA